MVEKMPAYVRRGAQIIRSRASLGFIGADFGAGRVRRS
jgi:hypothetical protein